MRGAAKEGKRERREREKERKRELGLVRQAMGERGWVSINC